MDVIGLLGVAIALFVSTNFDGLLVLLGFFSDSRFCAREITAGQYLGIGTIVGISISASLLSLVLAPSYIGLLGLVPIGIGAKRLIDLWRRRRAGGKRTGLREPRAASLGNVFVVANVAVATGGDNIALYVPVFATHSRLEIVLIAAVFAVMVAVWLALSHWLVNQPVVGAPIRRFGRVVMPFVLIALGLSILHRTGSFSLLT
jgi:cadmium resistance protein CadD (predicted permease)